ncbi:MAG TPA: MarR family transcriptional regulator [Acidimicrobiia bacterium]|nr:MarR family transcriptional regulator [Acidimicrobiia bacterium]
MSPAPTSSQARTATSEVAARLRLAVARLQRIVRQQAMGGLNLAEGSCLAIIDRHGPLSLSDVASRENLSAPTITKIVTRLEAEGLIERLADPADRRVTLVAVSNDGAGLLERVRSSRTAYLHRKLRELSDEDLNRLLAALPVLEALASEHTEADVTP